MSSDQSPENRLGATTRTYGGGGGGDAPEVVHKVGGQVEDIDDSNDLNNTFLQVFNQSRLERDEMQFGSCT